MGVGICRWFTTDVASREPSALVDKRFVSRHSSLPLQSIILLTYASKRTSFELVAASTQTSFAPGTPQPVAETTCFQLNPRFLRRPPKGALMNKVVPYHPHRQLWSYHTDGRLE